MSLLQFIVAIASILFLLFGIDWYKRQKATILHAITFIGGGAFVLVLALRPKLLDQIGSFFGTARGADIFVYAAVLLLAYFYIELFNANTKDKQQLTRLVAHQAADQAYESHKERIASYTSKTDKDEYIFHIRAYNEEKEIGKTIDSVLAAGFHKICVINDGSSDTTKKIVQERQEQNPQALILLINNAINRGGGAANQTGFTFLKKYGKELAVQWVVMFDADGQMKVDDMQTFMQQIEKDTKQNKLKGIYFGSRFIGKKAENMPKLRKAILLIGRLATRILYRVNIRDQHCGFRVLALDAVKKITIESDGMHYANELIEQVRIHKITFMELPVHIKYTDYSLEKGQKNSNSIKMGLEMLYKKFFYR